jgi:cation diffusion facilitator CzcD-associated flavoprotein CzcO
MKTEHFDVLIIGAGLSGIGAAYQLQTACPTKSYAILEARDAIGGTWDIFRYPGIRSDSDMYTLGYRFRPWTGDRSLADGPSILQYIRDTAAEAGIDRKVRFGHRVVRAEWSSEIERWLLDVEIGPRKKKLRFSCNFVHVCSGYYSYDGGYTPEFPGKERFAGQLIHPQQWPESLDYSGKRVVVIGSGATAITLVPAMAAQAAHVTMLQRSPTYVGSVPGRDRVAAGLRRVLPESAAYAVTRWKNVAFQSMVYQLSQRRPELMKALLRKGLEQQLPAGYDIDTHFTPTYNPWDQRLCAVPDGDLFKEIGRGRVSVVTDTIETFTERGIRLKSGAELDADIIVSATGFNLVMLGDAQLFIDGQQVKVADRLTYKGLMLSDIPNHAFTVGYTNSSWTLKADLVAEYVSRLLNYMDANGYTVCYAHNDDPTVTPTPLLDFGAGYVKRASGGLPKQGSKAPWRLAMNYALDVLNIRHGKLDDGALRFERAGAHAQNRRA